MGLSLARRRIVALAAVSASGCGRIAFDPLELGGFGTPEEVVLGDGQFADPTLSPDGLELYVSAIIAGGVGGEDLWVYRRATKNSAWGQPIGLPQLNSTGNDRTPELSSDGLELMFARGAALTRFDIVISRRASVDELAWGAPVPVPELGGGHGALNPFMLPDGLTLYLAVELASGDLDIHRATRDAIDMPWSPPVPVVGLNSITTDGDMWVSPDETFIMFDSLRDGAADFGLYQAARRDASEPWEAPELVQELSSPAHDTDPMLTPDRRTVIFASDRNGPRRIYSARR